MKDVERRLTALEQRTAARRQRRDPMRILLIASQVAAMDCTIPAPDGPKRQAQLDRVARLQAAFRANDPTLAIDDLQELDFAGVESWRPIHVTESN